MRRNKKYIIRDCLNTQKLEQCPLGLFASSNLLVSLMNILLILTNPSMIKSILILKIFFHFKEISEPGEGMAVKLV